MVRRNKRCVFAVFGSVGFDVDGQRQSGSDHTEHYQMMTITGDLIPAGVAPRAAQIAPLLLGAPRCGAIQSQTQESAVLECFVPFGLACDLNGGSTGRYRIQALGEITQSVVAKLMSHSQSAPPAGTH